MASFSSLLWFLTFRRSISLMQSCRALASIRSNIYQKIKRVKGKERKREGINGIWKKIKREINKQKKEKNYKHQCGRVVKCGRGGSVSHHGAGEARQHSKARQLQPITTGTSGTKLTHNAEKMIPKSDLTDSN